MMMDQATAMETLKEEGHDIPVMMVDGKLQPMLSLEAYFRLYELIGAAFSEEDKHKLKAYFGEE